MYHLCYTLHSLILPSFFFPCCLVIVWFYQLQLQLLAFFAAVVLLIFSLACCVSFEQQHVTVRSNTMFFWGLFIIATFKVKVLLQPAEQGRRRELNHFWMQVFNNYDIVVVGVVTVRNKNKIHRTSCVMHRLRQINGSAAVIILATTTTVVTIPINNAIVIKKCSTTI
jgi:phosphotransferase system  glucose/maltose/N-acetylglucosamine-specific IIC component